MGKTEMWDMSFQNLPKETLFRKLLQKDFPCQGFEQFLANCLPRKDGLDWAEQLARELGVSAQTIRNHVGTPSEKNRETYLAIAVYLGLDGEQADQFLTRFAKTGKLYARSFSDAPYYQLIHKRARFEQECPRQDGESIPHWVRRAIPESYPEQQAAALEAWLQPFFRRKFRKFSQLADNAGILEEDLRRWKQNCFTGRREAALAVAVSLGMSVDETNQLLSLCAERKRLDPQKPLDALYWALLDPQSAPGRFREHPRRQDLETVIGWARRIDFDGSVFGKDSEMLPIGTTHMQMILENEPIEVVRETLRSTPATGALLRKALPLLEEWVRSTWLEPHGGNRRWRSQGFRNPRAKTALDQVRTAALDGGRPVGRDELIKLGMLLRMDLEMMNRLLSVCGFRDVHANNQSFFEACLYSAWHALPKARGRGMPEEILPPDFDTPVADLQLYFSDEIESALRPMEKLLAEKEAERSQFRERGKQAPALYAPFSRLRHEEKKPPAWYLSAAERKECFCHLRADAVLQALWEYPRIWQEEQSLLEERLCKIKQGGAGYITQAASPDAYRLEVWRELERGRNVFGLTALESVDYSLSDWGFPPLGEEPQQKRADQRLLKQLLPLSPKPNPGGPPAKPDKKRLEQLCRQAREWYFDR